MSTSASSSSTEVAVKPKPAYVIERGTTLEYNIGVDGAKTVKKKGNEGVLFNIIYNWPNFDIWPFKLSVPAVGISSAAAGYFFNKTVRDSLYLLNTGRITSYLAVLSFPAFTAGVFHTFFVTIPILEQSTACPVCTQTRSALIQVTFGLLHPLIIAPITNYTFASRMKDVYLPNIVKDPWEVWKYTKSMYRPIRGHIQGIFAAQIVLGMGLAYLQQDCFYTKVLPVLEGRETFVKPRIPGIPGLLIPITGSTASVEMENAPVGVVATNTKDSYRN